jgi:hypothetical protein
MGKPDNMTRDEAVAFFSDFYGGEHHFPNKIKECGFGYSILHYNELATFDVDGLTRLVFMAHDYGYRVGIEPAMRYVRITIFKRQRMGNITTRHPSLEDALQQYRKWRPEGGLSHE